MLEIDIYMHKYNAQPQKSGSSPLHNIIAAVI